MFVGRFKLVHKSEGLIFQKAVRGITPAQCHVFFIIVKIVMSSIKFYISGCMESVAYFF